MKDKKLGLMELTMLLVIFMALVNAACILITDRDRKKDYDELNAKVDAIASHTDALDTVMVDFNDNLNEIRNNQDEIRQEQEERYEEIDKTFDKLWNSIHRHKDELEEQIKVVKESKALQKKQTTYVGAAVSYDSGYDHDFKSQGTVSDGEYNYTWYSQRVLPGGGLEIPGRHVDDEGFVRDEDGNLCVAARDMEKGTEIDTPYGKAIVYDYCPNSNLDIYTDW